MIPIVLSLLIRGKRLSIYQTLITLVFLFISFGGVYWQQGVALIAYVIWQTLLVWAFFLIVKERIKVAGFILAVHYWLFFLCFDKSYTIC